MKTIGRKIATAAVLAAGLAIVSGAPAYAQSGPCADITFTHAVLERFPQAPTACRGIVERDGEKFAQFQAEIQWVRGGAVHARLLNPDGSRSESVTFRPDRDARVETTAGVYRFWELSQGDRVSIYLPSDRWEVVTVAHESADIAQAPTVVTVAILPTPAAAPAQAAPAMLPATASPVPLIGLLGGLFLALAATLRFIRRRSTTV